MADTGNTYSSLEPGGRVTALSMEGGEMNLFGSTYTALELSEIKSYPKIQDAPTALPVDPTKGLIAGLTVAAVFAGLAIATVATGGAALAAVALAGAAVGAGAATVGMYQHDKKTGQSRSLGEFATGLAGGAACGAVAGAFLYVAAQAAPAAGAIAGLDAQYYLGASAFTQNVVPAIVTNGVYGLTFTTGVYTANDIYSNNSGYNIVLEKVFDHDAGAYEAFGMSLWFMSGAVTEYVSVNVSRTSGKTGVQYEKGTGGAGQANKYYHPDGSPIWPENKGFAENPVTKTLKPGTLVDRYGYDSGTFASPKGTPYSQRSLPSGTNSKPYTVYEVVKPVEVQAGKISPWFGEQGGGVQYEFNSRISDLVDQGVLRKVGN